MIKVGRSTSKPAAKSKRATAQKSTAAKTKLTRLEAMLRREEGATLEQLVEALSWQAHSIRGAMSGSLKKKRGLAIEGTKEEGQSRVYRIKD